MLSSLMSQCPTMFASSRSAAFLSTQPLQVQRFLAARKLKCQRSHSCPVATRTLRQIYATNTERVGTVSQSSSTKTLETPRERTSPQPTPDDTPPERMFSNLTRSSDGSLKREPPSELGCIALIAGTMIGAGVLALPTVAAPSGFMPSSTVLLSVWAYMAVSGLLISEVTINTACALGRAKGVSMLSLGRLTLGSAGAVVTAAAYVFLHLAILTAYTAQGGSILRDAMSQLNPGLAGAIFAGGIGGFMFFAPGRVVERVNNASVIAAAITFLGVVAGAASHADIGPLIHQVNWPFAVTGELIPVAFVSCVYHNVVSTISMRLEGDRRKIRRAILMGSGIPVVMFLLYDAVMLASGASDGGSAPASGLIIDVFSGLAIATSTIGFIEGLTDLCADARESMGIDARWPDYAATLFPPIVFAAAAPDIFFNALEVAGTYGIAVLFGIIPATMAWRNRRKPATQGFAQMIGGGNALLALMVTAPLTLIVSKLWPLLSNAVPSM